MALSMSFKGLGKTRTQLTKLGKQGKTAFRQAVYDEGVRVVEEAAKRAPSVTGNLRKSKYVSIPDARGNLVFGFGAIYAAAIEFGLKLITASRQQQKAAFARMRETGWSKSKVGGPGFFRGALAKTSQGRLNRIARRTKFFSKKGIKFSPNPNIPIKPPS